MVNFKGKMSLDLIPKLKPDLLLLDIMIPKIDRYEEHTKGFILLNFSKSKAVLGKNMN